MLQHCGILIMNGEGVTQELKKCIQKWEAVLADPAQYLSTAGITEVDFIFDPGQMGLHPENLESYLSGNLTIGDVLLSQPSVLLKC